MSVLTLVRHGQASFFADDYDRLSPLGEEQCRSLGRYWARQGLRIDEVYTGPRLRQRDSARLAGDEYQKSGLVWPEPTILDDLDEYDLDGLMGRFAPRLAAREPGFASLTEAHRREEADEERMRSFQRMFEVLLHHWQAAEPPDDDVESWPAFRLRVQRVIGRIQEQSGRGKRVVAFTSGGFIGGCVQHALGIADRMALELNWRVRNGSLTEFVFTPDRFTLDSFNAIPHLDDAASWTYR